MTKHRIAKRSLPGKRPAVLQLDSNVALDQFVFTLPGDIKFSRTDDIELSIYLDGCHPPLEHCVEDCCEEACCTPGWCGSGPDFARAVDFIGTYRFPVFPEDSPLDLWSYGHVTVPAADISPDTGQALFRYDDKVRKFLNKHAGQQLIGIFTRNCQPCSYVLFTSPGCAEAEPVRRARFGDAPGCGTTSCGLAACAPGASLPASTCGSCTPAEPAPEKCGQPFSRVDVEIKYGECNKC